jgi:hypothetical protein
MRNDLERQEFTQDEVYQVGRIIERYREGIGATLRDFAVLELQANVPANFAQPLRLARDAGMKVNVDTKLGVIGHPSGLPQRALSFQPPHCHRWGGSRLHLRRDCVLKTL